MNRAAIPIVLCADDYGQSQAISDGILDLLAAGRLSATSCMSESPRWPEDAVRLRPYLGRADIGLHFNLTHAFQGEAPGIGHWIARSLSGRIDRAAIRQSLQQQLRAFEDALGAPPDFIDGHQHVHLLPGIREEVFACALALPTRPYLRLATPRLNDGDSAAKAAILRLLGTGFAGAARRHGLRTNTAFAGLYSLDPAADYPALMRGWLRGARPGSLIMCHPGRATIDPADPIADTRPRELSYLQSAEFQRDCEHAGVSLQPLRSE